MQKLAEHIYNHYTKCNNKTRNQKKIKLNKVLHKMISKYSQIKSLYPKKKKKIEHIKLK